MLPASIVLSLAAQSSLSNYWHKVTDRTFSGIYHVNAFDMMMMIPYFIVAHWNELARGTAVNFRFIAQSRLETVGFKLVKEADVMWRGKAAVRLRMEASSMIIAQIVDPIFFIVEKDGAHHVLEYVGRTTPKLRDGNKWKDLDARTVYDW